MNQSSEVMQPSQSQDSGCDMGGALRESATHIAADCTECGACVRSCTFLQVHGTPKSIAGRLVKEGGRGRLAAFECSLCDLCGVVCPEDLSPLDMFMAMRRDAQQAGDVDPQKYAVLLGYERRGNSRLFSWYGLPKGCDTVFFPGCTFTGTRSQTAWALFTYIREHVPQAGVVLDCCNKPSHDLGRHEQFLEQFKEMNRSLVDHGVRKVLVTCPNCLKVFKQYGQGLEVTTVYQFMVQQGLPATLKVAENCVIHDPCPTRGEDDLHVAIRKLIEAQGVQSEEMNGKPVRTLCCGEGGAVGFVRPEFSRAWTKMRVKQAKGKRIITYCAGCVHYLSPYASVWHILDLIFFPAAVSQGRFRVAKAPLTYLFRLLFKWRLRRFLNVQDARG